MTNTNDTTITRTIRQKVETAARLKAARDAKGISQQQLSEMSGRSLSEIKKFEYAQRPVSFEAAEAFQKVFDLPAAWFMDMMSPDSLAATCAIDGFAGNPGEYKYKGNHEVIVIKGRPKTRDKSS